MWSSTSKYKCRKDPTLADPWNSLPKNPPAPRHSHGQQAGLEACAIFTIAQRLSLMAFAGNAFTILRAGLALTTHILPKISRLPALVAGFVLVLSLQRPGNAKTPVLVTSLVASSAKLSMTLEHTDFFNSHDSANAWAMAPFDMHFADFMAADFFMGAIAMKGTRSTNLGRAPM